MPLHRGLSAALRCCRGAVVAIGNFDGVHRGHQAMIMQLRRQADRCAADAVAVTFDPSPVEVLRPEFAPPRLMTLDRKSELLHAAGSANVLVLEASTDLLALEASEFFHQILIGQLGIRGLVEGANFRFGRDRGGDIELLAQLCESSKIELEVLPPVFDGTEPISSSRIREAVKGGHLAEAARLLGRPHEATGTVVRGQQRGRELGFPTANLAEITTLLPPDGVYAGRAWLEGRSFAAAVHLGANSTFGEVSRQLEVHLLDFSEVLYGCSLRVEFVEQLRGSVRFANRDELMAQLVIDCEEVRKLVPAASES